jgi:tetratricopeptide (TPR) repeat protein
MLMKIDRGLVLTLGVAAVTAACAGAAANGGMRMTVPAPDVACPGGELSAFPTADAAAVTLAMMGTVAPEGQQDAYAAALRQARSAIEEQPENAYGYYLAGQAALGAGDFAEAETMFTRAVTICPALAGYDVDQFRAMGSAQAFERGGALLQAQDTVGAMAAYQASLRLYPENYPADFYLGLISFQRQDTEGAVTHWRRVIEVIDRLPEAEVDEEVLAERRSARANALNALIFAARQYLEREETARAAELLAVVRAEEPNNAEAAYFHALALNTQQRWSELLPVAQRATELAPLSYGAWILYYNAYAGQSQAASQAGNAAQAAELARQARDISQRSEALPVQIEGVTVDATAEGTEVRGSAVGTGRNAPVQVEFILHSFGTRVGAGTVTITPPAEDQRQDFDLRIENTAPVTGVSYRVVGG